MSVDTLLRKEKDGTLYKKTAAAVTDQTSAVYQEFDPKNPTLTPNALRKKGDTPSRDDIAGKTTAEYRQDVSGTSPSRGMAPEGYST